MAQERYIKVKVKPRSKKSSVRYEDGTYIIQTDRPARDNKANFAVIDLLSEYLAIPKRNIAIKHGLKDKTKTICIVDKEEG